MTSALIAAAKHTSAVAHRTDNSLIGVWLWVALIVDVLATVFLMDWWLYHHNHKLLTTWYKDALRNPVTGAIVVFLTAGAIATLLWHFYNTRDGHL